MRSAMANETETSSRARVLVAAEETGGGLTIIEMHVKSPAPRHTHAHEDEIVYILEGHLTFHLNGATIDAPTGSCIILPRTVEHSYRVISDDARLLVIVTPPGLENFYREVGTPGSLPIEQLISTAARYGVTITGPAA
jgi:quercetin dioxygenase-like cupin family protein